MNILKMHTFGCKFLEVAFQVATDSQISCDIYDRIGAATQLKQSLSEQLRHMDKQLFLDIFQKLVPAGAQLCQYSNVSLIQIIESTYQLCMDQFRHFYSKYLNTDDELKQFIQGMYNQITQAVSPENSFQCQYAIQCFTIFSKSLTYEVFSAFKDEIAIDFYRGCLSQACNWIINTDTQELVKNQKFILSVTQALRSFFEPRAVSNIFVREEFNDLPICVTLLFQKIHQS